MPNYFDQFDAAASKPAGNYFDQFDAQQKPAQASTLGYMGSHLLGGFLEGGKWMGAAAGTEMGQPDLAEAMSNLPSGQQQADKMIYGTTNVPAPNTIARYGGAATSAVGTNPVMAAIAPGYTVAGALGGEGGSDINSATGSWMPDWLARIIGGMAGGAVYGGAKAAGSRIVDSISGADRALQNADEIRQRIQEGQGRFGQFQQRANAAAESISPQNMPPPSVSPDMRIPLDKTLGVLTNPGEGPPLPEVATSLRNTLNQSGGTLPASQVKPWLGEIQSGPLYRALNEDFKEAIGPENAEQLTKANQAAQARYLLEQARTPTGFYDPMKLTRSLAKAPTGETIGSVTPEMEEMTQHADQLANLMSPQVRANSQPSGWMQMARRLASMGTAMGVGHATGNPEIGAIIAGTILGHPEQGAQMAQLLYGLPRQPMTLPYGPLRGAIGALPGLLGQQ